MNEGLIAKRYAKALIDYASPRNEDAEIYAYMKTLHDSISREPRLIYILASPVVTLMDKESLVCVASGAKNEGTFRSFVRLIMSNGREALLRRIAIIYMETYRKEHNISVIHITSAEPMSDEFEKRVQVDVTERTHGQVEMDVRVDPSLEGGFIFQINDLKLDASVRGQLETIRQQFIKRNRIIV